MKIHEPGFYGYIGEGAVAIVAHKGWRKEAGLVFPAAARKEEIEPAIVVVIHRENVEPFPNARKVSPFCVIREGAVAIVVVIPDLGIEVGAGTHDVEIAVVVKIVSDHAARPPRIINAQVHGNIIEAGAIPFIIQT